MANEIEVEDAVEILRESSAIQEARLDALMQGVVLAAEQVQDTRLRLQETKDEVPGWGDFLGVVVLTFLLESPVLADVTRRLMRAVLGKQVKDYLLAKSIMENLTAVKRMRGRPATMATIVRGLERQLGEATGRETIHAYHRWALQLSQMRPETMTAVYKTAWSGGSTVSTAISTPLQPSVSGNDSPGVALLAAAHDQILANRLAHRFVVMRVEHLIRAYSIPPTELHTVLTSISAPELKVSYKGRDTWADLTWLRHNTRRNIEPVIWARQYYFTAAQDRRLNFNVASIDGVPEAVLDYWRERFGDLIDVWNEQQKSRRWAGRFNEWSEQEQVQAIYTYLKTIVGSVPDLDPTN